jgi:DNA-binding CsgD family transcriptional regulator
MRAAVTPAHLDPARLAELQRFHLLDTPPEVPFDRLTRLAARILDAPIALVSLVDEHRQFFKSAYGLPEPLATCRETPLHMSICKSVVESACPVVIGDAQLHESFRLHPAIVELKIAAYLGIPLTTALGFTLGSFCVIDTKRREWTIDEQTTMVELAASVMSEIALRFAYDELKAANVALQREASEREHLLRALQDSHESLRAAQVRASASGSLVHVGPPQLPLPTAALPAWTPDAEILAAAMRDVLSKRQREVFNLLLRGLQTKEVARELNLSHRTIDVHRAKILERLNVSTFAQVFQQLLGRGDMH